MHHYKSYYLLVIIFVATGCAFSPSALKKPLTISGIVVYPDGRPATNIKLTFWWRGFNLSPKGSSKILASIRSNNNGKFSHIFHEGPVYMLVARSDDKKYLSAIHLKEIPKKMNYVLS